MEDKKEPTMSDQGFIDNIVDRVRDLLPKQPEPGTPATPPTDSPPWLNRILGMALTILLAFIAARYGVTPTPLPSLQSQPQIVVLQVPAGATILEAKKGTP